MTGRCRMNPNCEGYLTLVLHCHLPYIRHSEHEDMLEERWFYEAMLETYLPLLDMLDRLARDQVPLRLTISMTPTLLAMMSDPLMKRRCVRHFDRLIELASKETERLRSAPDFRSLAEMYLHRFRYLRQLYMDCHQNIISRYKEHQDSGRIEIITCAATHAFLPLVKTEEAVQAQIRTAVTDYERHFGRKPRGIWLPECAFTPGVDRILKQHGIQFFIADTAAIQFATPRPNRGLFAPVSTPYGVHVFARDPESSEQVWSSVNGYPGDVYYREFYRDIGWDLGWNDPEEWEYIRPYVLPTHDRIHTGLKYYRITGPGDCKEIYNPEMAAERARVHAGHFLESRLRQIREARVNLDRPPLIVSPYDAELFGHWWYEGPVFLENLIRMIHEHGQDLALVTPSDYLSIFPESDTAHVPASSWGRNHSAEVWLKPENDWIYRHLHEAEEQMIRLASTYSPDSESRQASPLVQRALRLAAQQLMLAQSSDWAFIIDAGTVVHYAKGRVVQHLSHFRRLVEQVERGEIDPDWLEELEEKYPCFPLLDYTDYAAVEPYSPVSILSERVFRQAAERTVRQRNIVMLAWEYPPRNVGGLSRAVCELSETLAELGEIVHVVTPAHYGTPYFELRNSVYIHRVPVLTSGPTDFGHWVLEMNLAMTDHLSQWLEAGGRIDLIHAHDWMVYDTAHEMKTRYGIPVVATIHATEWGRNQGQFRTPFQKRIHHLEWQLTNEADEVFVCSRYMKREVMRLFDLPEGKVHTVCNGIRIRKPAESGQPPALTGEQPDGGHTQNRREEQNRKPQENSGVPQRKGDEPIVFFIGRLVYEKGVQVLLQAAPVILSQVPGARFVIAGEGPMRGELEALAAQLRISDRVMFTGFLDEAGKTYWYSQASVVAAPSLYEPFGLVALEAMHLGCPVVVSDTGGLADIVEHGVDGYKALPNHVDSLAWHVVKVLQDPETAARMAAKAYQKLHREYDWRILAERVRQVYDRHADRPRSARFEPARSEPVRAGVSGTWRTNAAGRMRRDMTGADSPSVRTTAGGNWPPVTFVAESAQAQLEAAANGEKHVPAGDREERPDLSAVPDIGLQSRAPESPAGIKVSVRQ